MSHRLRLGALLVCVGMILTGIVLAVTPPSPTGFDTVKTRLGDIRTEPIPGIDAGVDRFRYLRVSGAACSDYYYRDSWARSVGLPTLIDTYAGEPVTIYATSRSCAGFNSGGHGRVVALLFADHLYATDEYLHPTVDRLGNLPAALLLAVAGLGGMLLLLRRR